MILKALELHASCDMTMSHVSCAPSHCALALLRGVRARTHDRKLTVCCDQRDLTCVVLLLGTRPSPRAQAMRLMYCMCLNYTVTEMLYCVLCIPS